MKKVLFLINLAFCLGFSFQTQTASAAAVPSSTCRAGYTYQGGNMCMSAPRGPDGFPNAALYCQGEGARVADSTDWRARTYWGDGWQAPYQWWLGPITGDNEVLFVNWANNPGDFDGVANKWDSRYYACAHDLSR